MHKEAVEEVVGLAVDTLNTLQELANSNSKGGTFALR